MASLRPQYRLLHTVYVMLAASRLCMSFHKLACCCPDKCCSTPLFHSLVHLIMLTLQCLTLSFC